MKRGESPYTREKQEVFRTIMEAHLSIVKAIKARHPRSYPHYVYFDLNAGSGYNDEIDMPGSPLIALSLADRIQMPIEPWFFEIDPARMAALMDRFLGKGRRGVTFLPDHRVQWRLAAAMYPGDRGPVDGLVYSDSFADPIPIDAINGLTAGPLSKVDVLLHINANGAYKRPRGRGHASYQGRYLANDIARVNKQYWWVREPATDWQWTFLLGSNWVDMPEFRKLGFHRLDSVRGLDILDKLNVSQRELDAKRPRLPFDLAPECHTGPMPNTSDIRRFWLSAPSSCSERAAGASDAGSGHPPSRTT